MHFMEFQKRRIVTEGRLLRREDTLYMGHTNTRISFAVRGSELRAHITSNHDLFPEYHCLLVYVDGELVHGVPMKEKYREEILCYLNPEMPHIVTLHKISEATTNWIGISHLQVPGGALLNMPKVEQADDGWTVKLDEHKDTSQVVRIWSDLVDAGFFPRVNAYRVLVLGDSITCGYGLAEGGYEDGSRSYAHLALRRMGYAAEYIAASGFGVYQDCVGDRGRTIPGVYPYTNYFMDKKTLYNVREFEPQLVILYLGTNDSYHLQSREQVQAFRQCYLEFVERIHKDYPGAAFLLLAGLMTQDVNPVIEELCGELHPLLDARVDYLELPLQNPLQDGVVKNNHPSVDTHKKAAALLYEKLLEIKC